MRDQVEEVKQKSDIVSIIGDRVSIKKAGRNFRGLCPFHGEKTPSFFVTPEMQIYKCFGCGKSGDVYSFLQEFEGMDFSEALEFLAQKSGVKLVRRGVSREERDKKRLYEVLHLASEFYHYLLTKHKVGEKARKYLKTRRIFGSSVETFGLGYAPEGWEELIKFLVRKKKYKMEELVKVGLVIGSTRSTKNMRSRFYDRFRGRVMFPLKDLRGRVVGFSGRLLPEAESQSSGGKYVNTPETGLYHKRELLYGLEVTRGEIKKKDRVVVVEGETDEIWSYQAGVKNVVAIKGSALTEEQVRIIRRLTRNVVLALDADQAGDEATKRGIEVADKEEMNLRVSQIKGGKDPAEIASRSASKWRGLVKGAVSVYDFYIASAFEKYESKTGEGKRKISQELSQVLARISNAVEQSHYVKEVAGRLGVAESVMIKEVAKSETKRKVEVEDKKESKTEEKRGRKEKLERQMVGLVLRLKGVIKEGLGLVKDRWIGSLGVKRLVKSLREYVLKTKRFELSEWVEKLPAELKALVQEIYLDQELVAEESDEEEIMRRFKEVVVEMRKIWHQEKLKRLADQIGVLESKKLSKEEEGKLKQLQVKFAQESEAVVSLG